MQRMFAITALLALSGAIAGCGAGAREANPDALTGKITYNGQPLKAVTVMAIGGGTPAGGTTNDEGVYTIPNPPKGKLKFQLTAPGSGKTPFPAKYTKPDNDLSFEYTGGKQTYNMDLK
jgi:hypothetical protein